MSDEERSPWSITERECIAQHDVGVFLDVPPTTCPLCHHAAHEPGDCMHGYSPHPTTWAPDGMREDATGSGCTCGQREESDERMKDSVEYVTAADLAQCVPVLQLSDEASKAYEAALRAGEEEISRLILGRYSDGISRVRVFDSAEGIYSQPDTALTEVRAGLMKKGAGER